jgi:hypothetical protein
MDITQDSVAKAKKTLARMSQQKKSSVTGRKLVRDLAPEIHARLNDGHGMKAIWFMIITDLHESERMTFATFQKYWQAARQELGLAPMRSRSVPALPTENYPVRAQPLVTQPQVKSATAGDFRIDPEDI